MENYTELIEILTSINNNLGYIASYSSWITMGIFFLLFFKAMNSNESVNKLYHPIDSIGDCLAGIMDKLKDIDKSVKKLGEDKDETDSRRNF